MGLQQDAIYGYAPGPSQTITPQMLNPGVMSINELVANGIRGAAEGAINAQIAGAYASGQLVPPVSQVQARASTLNGMILLAGLAYLVMGD